jgi:hypothetical protein
MVQIWIFKKCPDNPETLDEMALIIAQTVPSTKSEEPEGLQPKNS